MTLDLFVLENSALNSKNLKAHFFTPLLKIEQNMSESARNGEGAPAVANTPQNR